MNRFVKVFFVMLVVFSMAACGSSAGSAPTAAPTNPPPTKEPTSAPAPTATQAPTEAATEAPTEAPPAFTTFESPEGVLSLDVPGAWVSETDNSTPNLTSYLFHPETGGAVIHYMLYDDGKTYINQGDAGKITLQLLNQGYTNGAGDIKISKDEPMKDGSEELTWESLDGGYSGITIFKGKGTTLALITFAYSNDQIDQYKDALDKSYSTLVFNQ